MLDKKKRDHCKKSIWVIAVAGVVLVSALICVFVYYIGRNQPKQISSVTIMFSGVVEDTPIKFVSFELAEGFDNIEGKSIIQAETEADGTANFEVPEGEYTLRWHGGSYFDGYQNVTVQGETVILRKWLIGGPQNPAQPIEEANDTHSAYILLEWQSEENLDLCVYQEENDRCIGVEQTKDAEGSFLYRDNSGDQGYELVYLADATIGNYRIYVKDCDSILNDRESRMEAEGVSVSIYTAQGAVYQKSAEAGESAGLWECASLCGGEVSGQDRYLYDLTDYAWALRDGDDPASWLEGAYIKAEETYFYSYGDHRLPDDGLLDGRLPDDRLLDDRLLYNVTRKEFDADENITVETHYNADGEQDARYVHEYDENGNRIAEYAFYYKRLDLPGGGEQPNKIWEWKYSEEGELIGYCEYDADGIVASQYEQSYDENGNLIKEYTYPDFNGYYSNDSSEECQYEYDADGHRTAEIHYIDGEKTYRNEYEYDEDGKETVCYVYYYDSGSEDDYLERRCESEYDENGNLKVYTLYICSDVIKKQ